MPSAPQKRAWVKGRSLETHTTTVFSKSAASSLNLRTLIAQVPVSSDGKMFSTTRLPARSALVTELRSCPTSSKPRSEEHTSELQSRGHLVCRLLLEKKKKTSD